MRNTALVSFFSCCFLLTGMLTGDVVLARDLPTETTPLTPMFQAPKIVNGLTTHEEASVVALISASSGEQFCTGTLVGCQTVVTAAHCICQTDGSDCQAGGGALASPAAVDVFLQHAGVFGVRSIHVPAGYVFGSASDIAVLELASPVTGVAPTPINTRQRLANGSSGTIVGYGLTEGTRNDYGIKRTGQVQTSDCSGIVPTNQHICWQFTNPIGTPGLDSNTCPGDSGGPLFATVGGQRVLAGVTSGGDSFTCLPTDRSFDADVFQNRAFVQNRAGSDLNNTTCGSLPQAGAANTSIFGASGDLGPGNRDRQHTVQVPANTDLVRFTVNGTSTDSSQLQLFVRQGSAPTTTVFDCRTGAQGEACEFSQPAAGTWHLLVQRAGPAGEYQTTATLFLGSGGGGGGGTNPCQANATTLCVDDQAGDQRFEIKASFETQANGGQSGDGRAIPLASLGVSRGGLFWFFSADNPELLIKVLNGCAINNRYWIFTSAGTNVGMTITVRDTVTGAEKSYNNTDGNAAEAVQDTSALACS